MKDPNPSVSRIEQEEGNKAISIFMGDVTDNIEEWRNSDKKLVGTLDYHKDWNALMPVVEKIEKLQSFYTSVNNSQCIIGKDGIAIVCVVADSKIKAVHEAVIQFIKWYSQNKPTP